MEEVFTHVVVEGKPKWSWKEVLQVISSVMPTFRSTLKKKKNFRCGLFGYIYLYFFSRLYPYCVLFPLQLKSIPYVE